MTQVKLLDSTELPQGLKYPRYLLKLVELDMVNYDIACFEVDKGEAVQIIHDYALSGYEQRQVYENFWDWFRDAIEEMIEFE